MSIGINSSLANAGLTLVYESHLGKYLTLYNKYNSEVNSELVISLEDALIGYDFVSVIEQKFLLFREKGE